MSWSLGILCTDCKREHSCKAHQKGTIVKRPVKKKVLFFFTRTSYIEELMNVDWCSEGEWKASIRKGNNDERKRSPR